MGRLGLELIMPGSPPLPGRISSRGKLLLEWHRAMLAAFGPLHWWPATSPFEVAVGAILTQNTAWANVEKAIVRLREMDGLAPATLRSLDTVALEEALRPSGYFRQKAAKLRALLDLLEELGGLTGGVSDQALACFAAIETGELREKLLSVRGIGPETADCILLYAVGRPSFVADAYTRRILSRHGLAPEDASYDELRDFFMDALPEDTALYNEYHAQLVRVGHLYCRKSKPLCGACPLGVFLEYEPV